MSQCSWSLCLLSQFPAQQAAWKMEVTWEGELSCSLTLVVWEKERRHEIHFWNVAVYQAFEGIIHQKVKISRIIQIYFFCGIQKSWCIEECSFSYNSDRIVKSGWTVILRSQACIEAQESRVWFSLECSVVKSWLSEQYPLCVFFFGICCVGFRLLSNSDVFLFGSSYYNRSLEMAFYDWLGNSAKNWTEILGISHWSIKREFEGL